MTKNERSFSLTDATSDAAPGRASEPPPTPPARRRTPPAAAVLLLVPVIVALALWAFAWPAARVAPRDLPLGVAGPPAAAAQAERQLARQDGAFEVHRYADQEAARQAVRDREVYGALVVTPAGPRLLTASAASPVAAQLLEGAAERMAAAGTRVPTEDVVAAPPGDPRGAAFGASLLPLALAGVAGGVLVWVVRLRGTRGMLVTLAASALVGVVGAGIAHSWLGVLTGDWWAEAGAIGLTSLAISSTVAGLATLLGYPGVALGSLLAVLLGNPFSGVTSAPEMLPEPAGALGQLLPPGAGGSLLRSVAYFDGAAAQHPAVVLLVWSVLGLLAVGLARPRTTDRPGDRPGDRAGAHAPPGADRTTEGGTAPQPAPGVRERPEGTEVSAPRKGASGMRS